MSEEGMVDHVAFKRNNNELINSDPTEMAPQHAQEETYSSLPLLQLDFDCNKHNDYFEIILDSNNDKDTENEILEKSVKIKLLDGFNKVSLENILKKLELVSRLCIVSQKITFSLCGQVKHFLKFNNNIRYLHLHFESIGRPDYLAHIFENYSSLEEVTIDIQGEISGTVNNLIEKNKKLRGIVKNAIVTINSLKSKNKEDRLIDLAIIYDEIWDLCDEEFIEKNELFSLISNDDFKKEIMHTRSSQSASENMLIIELEAAEQWHPLVASKMGDLEKLKKIFDRRSKLNVNKIYTKYQPHPTRLIDVASELNIIKYLINEKNADAITIASDHSETRLLNSHNILSRSVAVKINENILPSLKNFQTIIYDALAFTIHTGEVDLFRQIFTRYFVSHMLSMNFLIQNGIYGGYTLVQRACIDFENIKNAASDLCGYLKSLSSNDRKEILISRFPKKEDGIHRLGITVLEYLTFKLNLNFLLKIIGDDVVLFGEELSEIANEPSLHSFLSGYKLFQIFIHAALDEFEIIENYTVVTKKHTSINYENIAQYYKYLISIELKATAGNIENLKLRESLGMILPVFHFAAINAHTNIAIAFAVRLLFQDFFSIHNRIDYRGYQNLGSFHMAVLFGNDSFCQQLLIKMLNKREMNYPILELLNEKIIGDNEFNGCTLFQIACLRNLIQFIKTVVQYFDNDHKLINAKYPSDHEYSEWTPIQVALFLLRESDIYERKDTLFAILINVKYINFDVIYPANIHLFGLNLLQALIIKIEVDQNLRPSGKDSEVATGRGYFVRCLIEKLNSDQINYACRERNSEYYGMTALHIGVIEQKEELVSALLASEKTNYTVCDANKKIPADHALQIRNSCLQSYLEKAQRQHPQHTRQYLDALKYNSEVCPSLQIRENKWVLSIAQENNNDHAFLIIEGLTHNSDGLKAEIWVAHLYLPRSSGGVFAAISGRVRGRVEIGNDATTIKVGVGKTKSLLPGMRGKLKLLTLKPSTMLFYMSAYVASDNCLELIREIKKDADIKNNISYSFFGNGRVFVSSSSSRHHNCVSWAIEKYNKFAPENMRVAPDWTCYFLTNARGFLNEEFIYVADSSISEDILGKKITRLDNERQRLLEIQNNLLSRQNAQWGIIASISIMYILDKKEWPYSCKLLISFAAGLTSFFVTKSNLFSPKHREYYDDPQKVNNSPLNKS